MCLLLSPNLFSVQTDLLDIVDTDMQREIYYLARRPSPR